MKLVMTAVCAGLLCTSMTAHAAERLGRHNAYWLALGGASAGYLAGSLGGGLLGQAVDAGGSGPLVGFAVGGITGASVGGAWLVHRKTPETSIAPELAGGIGPALLLGGASAVGMAIALQGAFHGDCNGSCDSSPWTVPVVIGALALPPILGAATGAWAGHMLEDAARRRRRTPGEQVAVVPMLGRAKGLALVARF